MRKDNLITFRVEEPEHNFIKTQADEIGLTVSEYVRKRIQNKPIVKIYHSKELIKQITGIGNNINQIARHTNTIESINNSDIHEIKCDISNLKQQIYQFIGSADVRCQ